MAFFFSFVLSSFAFTCTIIIIYLKQKTEVTTMFTNTCIYYCFICLFIKSRNQVTVALEDKRV